MYECFVYMYVCASCAGRLEWSTGSPGAGVKDDVICRSWELNQLLFCKNWCSWPPNHLFSTLSILKAICLCVVITCVDMGEHLCRRKPEEDLGSLPLTMNLGSLWSHCFGPPSHLYLLRIQADMACFSMGVMGIKHLSSHCTLNCLTHWNISPVSHEHSLNNCADEFHLTRVDRYLGKDKSGYNWQILFSSKSFLPSSLPSLPSFQTDFEFMVFFASVS